MMIRYTDYTLQNLNATLQIERNTHRTANNTDCLANIESRLVRLAGEANVGSIGRGKGLML